LLTVRQGKRWGGARLGRAERGNVPAGGRVPGRWHRHSATSAADERGRFVLCANRGPRHRPPRRSARALSGHGRSVSCDGGTVTYAARDAARWLRAGPMRAWRRRHTRMVARRPEPAGSGSGAWVEGGGRLCQGHSVQTALQKGHAAGRFVDAT
jgi:hypothetical protein